MIKDRIILSAMAGASGTIAKSIFVKGLKKLGLAEFNGAETAAGMLLEKKDIHTPGGLVVGNIANMLVGMSFGVGLTYIFSATGKDKILLKGAGISGLLWTFFYGNYARMGGSTLRPALPKTILSNFTGHLLYGIVSSYFIDRLGDPALFNGEIPLIKTQQRNHFLTHHDRILKKGTSKNAGQFTIKIPNKLLTSNKIMPQ